MNVNWIPSVPDGSAVKNPPASARDAGDTGFIPGLERSPGEENGSSLQYSCLENPMDRGAWQATVQRVTKSQTRLNYYAHQIFMFEHYYVVFPKSNINDQ